MYGLGAIKISRCAVRAVESALLPVSLGIGDVHTPSPQQPRSAPVNSCSATRMEPTHLIVGLPLFLLPPVGPSIMVFSKEPCLLMTCPEQGSFSFVIFASSNVPGLICSRAYEFIFLVARVSVELSAPHHLADETPFPPISPQHRPTSTSVPSD